MNKARCMQEKAPQLRYSINIHTQMHCRHQNNFKVFTKSNNCKLQFFIELTHIDSEASI